MRGAHIWVPRLLCHVEHRRDIWLGMLASLYLQPDPSTESILSEVERSRDDNGEFRMENWVGPYNWLFTIDSRGVGIFGIVFLRSSSRLHGE